MTDQFAGKTVDEWREIARLLRSLDDPKLTAAAQELGGIVSSVEILKSASGGEALEKKDGIMGRKKVSLLPLVLASEQLKTELDRTAVRVVQLGEELAGVYLDEREHMAQRESAKNEYFRNVAGIWDGVDATSTRTDLRWSSYTWMVLKTSAPRHGNRPRGDGGPG